MSTVAKILVVVNLVLAVVFLAASATFLGQKDLWKLKHKEDTERLEAEKVDLQTNLDRASDKFQSQLQQTREHVTDLETLKAKFHAKESEYKRMRDEHDSLLGKFELLAQTEKDLQQNLAQLDADKLQLIKEKDAAFDDRRKALEEANTAVTERRRVETLKQGIEDQLAETEKRLVATADDLAKTELLVKAYEDRYPKLTELIGVETIKAAVSGVSTEQNIVLLSVGGDDKVKVGYQFTIYRGNEYVGVVVIDSVERDHCSGYSKKELQAKDIQVGDKATTRF